VIKDSEKGAAGFKSGIITSPPRSLKTDLRDVSVGREIEVAK